MGTYTQEGALKEFLYVDVDRTRSLLAQLQGGLVDQLTSESADTKEGKVGASFFGIGGNAGFSREARHQESRSFQDLIFVVFENLANESGMIRDLDADHTSVSNWQQGNVHEDLEEGQIVRITCDVQLLDGGLFGNRIQRVQQMVDGILELTPQPTPANSKPKEREWMAKKAKAEIMGGTSPDHLDAITRFVEAFIGDDIAFRALACGQDHRSSGFGGTLLGRREYIQEERDSLFSRYGLVASNWTSVMQVAAIPKKDSRAAGSEQGDETDEDEGLLDDTGNIDRAAVESMAAGLLDMMEKIGISDGPRWPTISVTPLAVYRTIPGAIAAE